ncbi:MAG: DUF308 domain-containing protein [Thermoproteota archaeon]
MSATKTKEVKSPSWIRALQIGIGAIAIGLSISAIIYPVITTVATFTVGAIILLLLGIEQVVTGIFLYKESRFAHIGLGALVIILSSIVMAYPLATATVVIWLAAFALLLGGIASIISGIWVKNRRNYRTAGRGSRALSIAAGVLAVALSISIMVFPVFGVELAGVLIGIALLFYGIRLVGTGISGRGRALTSASADNTTAA